MEQQADVSTSPPAALSGPIAIKQAACSLSSDAGRSLFLRPGLTRPHDCHSVAARADKAFGGCGALVNPAGMRHRIRVGVARAHVDLASVQRGVMAGATVDFDQTTVGVADAPLAVPA